MPPRVGAEPWESLGPNSRDQPTSIPASPSLGLSCPLGVIIPQCREGHCASTAVGRDKCEVPEPSRSSNTGPRYTDGDTEAQAGEGVALRVTQQVRVRAGSLG